MIKSGINQIGGKFRLRKTLDQYTPYHEYFLSLFCGSCIYELNKGRPFHYECFNDKNPRFVNYFIVIKNFREEFEKRKHKGPFTINSRYLYELLNKGVLKPRDMIEDAILFHYQLKLSFGSQLKYRGIVPETTSKKIFIEAAKKDFIQVQSEGRFKSNLGKTTRPYTNNDCGILTKINPKVSERLKYVILENRDFKKCYENFYNSFHKKKKLKRECFIYADPPYPSTEHYYSGLFNVEDHQSLIEIMLDSPFNFMLSIGGACKIYLDAFQDNKDWIVKDVYTKYSIDSNSQKLSKEYLIMNYDINKIPKMTNIDNQMNLGGFL